MCNHISAKTRNSNYKNCKQQNIPFLCPDCHHYYPLTFFAIVLFCFFYVIRKSLHPILSLYRLYPYYNLLYFFKRKKKLSIKQIILKIILPNQIFIDSKKINILYYKIFKTRMKLFIVRKCAFRTGIKC